MLCVLGSVVPQDGLVLKRWLQGFQPFKPQDLQTNSPDWSLYISSKNSWENLV